MLFRLHATLSNRHQKTYLSGAPDCFTAVRSLEYMLKQQSYSFVITKVERCEASEI